MASRTSAPPAESELPALRADARRNRERVLVAARAAFAERGLDAQVDEIAREAGVGVGTVYRRFRTKEGLLEAVALEPLARLIERASEALSEESPGAALEGFMRWSSAMNVADRCVHESGVGTLAASAPLAEMRLRLGRLVATLLTRAQASGAVRADLVMEDLPMLIFGIGCAERLDPCMPRTTWERHLEIVLDGIRAPGHTPLPPPPVSTGPPSGV